MSGRTNGKFHFNFASLFSFGKYVATIGLGFTTSACLQQSELVVAPTVATLTVGSLAQRLDSIRLNLACATDSSIINCAASHRILFPSQRQAASWAGKMTTGERAAR